MTYMPFNTIELEAVDLYFQALTLKKKQFLIQEGAPCKFIAFIVKGAIRHYHIKDGEEKSCDLSLENTFITEFKSFNTGIPSNITFQALEATSLLTISKKHLLELYEKFPKYETFGRIITEQIVSRTTEIAMSLLADKPEERYLKLLEDKPEIFQRIPLKYIANFLGVSPESLSRIRKRVHSGLKS